MPSRPSRMLSAAVLFAVLAASPASAERLTKGDCVVSLGLHGGTAEIVAAPLSINAMFTSDEVGAQVGFSYFLSDDWAAVVSGDFGFGSEKFEASGGGTDEFTISTWDVRVGLDRYAFINDDVAIYAGPGLRYWTGSGEFEPNGGPSEEWPDVTQLAFNGRLGMYARLSSSIGLFGHIGHVIGINSADDSAGDASWWTSSPEGTVGLAVDF